MFKSIYDDIKREYTYGNMVTRIIIVNVFAFLLLNLAKLIYRMCGDSILGEDYIWFLKFFSLPADLKMILYRPWTLFTHMFIHDTGYHLIFNMLLFLWFGRIIGDLVGNKRILPLYILAGLTSALFYLLSFHLLKYGDSMGDFALGASGAIMGFIMGATILSPNYKVNLILIGEVSIKYIALVLFLIDFVSIAKDSNAGGHFAHLGGALMGWIYISNLKSGYDIGRPIENALNWLGSIFSLKRDSVKNKRTVEPKKTNSPLKVVHTNTQSKERLIDQDRIDLILEKIKKSGYDTLTDIEKDDLFKASQKD